MLSHYSLHAWAIIAEGSGLREHGDPGFQYGLYALIIIVGGGLLLWWLNRQIKKTQQRLTHRVEKLKRFDAIRTESPVDDPNAEARERGLENLATRFSMLRRLLLPGVSVVLLVALVLPLISGIPATFLSLLVAVVGVVAGIAAKPIMENLMAGVVLSLAHPIRIGDTVMIDQLFGTVEKIGITHTVIKVWDWRRYMVPNSQMIGKEFVNYSIIDRYQWAYVEFWVSPEADINRVRDLALESPKNSKHYAPYEDPRFWIMEMGKEGIRCWAAAWADTPYAAWQLTHDMRTSLITQFAQEGIRTHGYRHIWDQQKASDSSPLPPAP